LCRFGVGFSSTISFTADRSSSRFVSNHQAFSAWANSLPVSYYVLPTVQNKDALEVERALLSGLPQPCNLPSKLYNLEWFYTVRAGNLTEHIDVDSHLLQGIEKAADSGIRNILAGLNTQQVETLEQQVNEEMVRIFGIDFADNPYLNSRRELVKKKCLGGRLSDPETKFLFVGLMDAKISSPQLSQSPGYVAHPDGADKSTFVLLGKSYFDAVTKFNSNEALMHLCPDDILNLIWDPNRHDFLPRGIDLG